MNQFEAFFARHRERLFGYLMRLTGDYYLSADLLQESFARYLSAYGDQGQNLTLLYTIARNALLDIRRKQSRTPYSNEEPADPGSDPEKHLLVREEYQQMMTALGRLQASDREILALAATGELKYRQIAEILRLNENAVKVRIHRARLRLRQIIEEMDNERPFDQHLHRR